MTRNTTCLPSVTSDSSHPPPERPLDRPRPAPSPASGTVPRPSRGCAVDRAGQGERAREGTGRRLLSAAAGRAGGRRGAGWVRPLLPPTWWDAGRRSPVVRSRAEAGERGPATHEGGVGRWPRGTGVRTPWSAGRGAWGYGGAGWVRPCFPLPRWDAGRWSPAVPSRAEAGEWGPATHEGEVGRWCGEPRALGSATHEAQARWRRGGPGPRLGDPRGPGPASRAVVGVTLGGAEKA